VDNLNRLVFKKKMFANFWYFTLQFLRQISFGSAQTGSVHQAKKVFEKKLDEEVEIYLTNNSNPIFNPILNPGSFPGIRTFSSPFRPVNRNTPVSSSAATPLSMRRRSPSPVHTGNVSRARMRFESGESVTSGGRTRMRFESGSEIRDSYSAASAVLQPLNNHQTLPRTFRLNQFRQH
jgi:hypothetical protein